MINLRETAGKIEFLDGFDILLEKGALRRCSGRARICMFDFAGVFPTEKNYYMDGWHVNIEGAKLKARLFADYLIESGLVQN